MSKLICDSLSFSTKHWSCHYNLAFESNRCYVVCGPSGSGKSTLINLIAGFTAPTSGQVLIDGNTISHLAPHQRGVNFMGQHDGLFPGISILENLMLALHDSSLSVSDRREKIRELTQSLGLDESLLERLPSQVSGGQLSRSNLARTLLRPGRWLLLDEPFAAVDRPTRLQILAWLKARMFETKSTIILISHDLDDVFTIATDVTVIHIGQVVDHAPLAKALVEPQSVTTARLLRAGLILLAGDNPQFIPAQHLSPNRTDLSDVPDQFLASHTFRNPQITRVGQSMRIIDLDDGNDLTLPFQAEFSDTVWFDSRRMTPIK